MYIPGWQKFVVSAGRTWLITVVDERCIPFIAHCYIKHLFPVAAETEAVNSGNEVLIERGQTACALYGIRTMA